MPQQFISISPESNSDRVTFLSEHALSDMAHDLINLEETLKSVMPDGVDMQKQTCFAKA